MGNKSDLGYCYWNWGLLARAQGDRKTEKEKLEQALAIFTELKMPRERDAVQAELDKMGATVANDLSSKRCAGSAALGGGAGLQRLSKPS